MPGTRHYLIYSARLLCVGGSVLITSLQIMELRLIELFIIVPTVIQLVSGRSEIQTCTCCTAVAKLSSSSSELTLEYSQELYYPETINTANPLTV